MRGEIPGHNREELPGEKENGEVEETVSAGFTTEELIDACRTVLTGEDIEFMIGMEPEDAIEYAMSALLGHGIEDADAYLAERGLGYTEMLPPPLIDYMNGPSKRGEAYTTEEQEKGRRELEDRKIEDS
jgi:hypothetical protein